MLDDTQTLSSPRHKEPGFKRRRKIGGIARNEETRMVPRSVVQFRGIVAQPTNNATLPSKAIGISLPRAVLCCLLTLFLSFFLHPFPSIVILPRSIGQRRAFIVSSQCPEECFPGSTRRSASLSVVGARILSPPVIRTRRVQVQTRFRRRSPGYIRSKLPGRCWVHGLAPPSGRGASATEQSKSDLESR